ncbi:hypothetical protein GH714_003272 [Hevea brasiliensis]|nr:hypothetical protein GH714_003272 [Hevea brasiliensis]
MSERMVEFGSIGHPPHGVSSTEVGRQPNSGSAPAHNFSVSQATPGMQGPKPVLAINQDRMAMQSYQLKDEGDFPPLSDSSGKGLSIRWLNYDFSSSFDVTVIPCRGEE